LEREFSENEKELIINIIDNKEIFDDSHIYLALFLSNLIDVYKKQKTNDDSIKTFSTIVNEYLEDKEVFYDERKVEISIKDKKKKKAVKLENLSSGEKQIISLFSKLYLERTGDLAILIDEPELSLSLEWQKRLLVDIVKCPNVVLLVAATHSPFIFSNELDKFAQPLLS
jgi:predicted ATPase